MIEYIEQSDERYGPPAPVPIIQEEVEFSRLLELYIARSPKRVLEIGTYAGGTLFHWLRFAVGALVVSVDDSHLNSERYREWLAPGSSLELAHGDTRDPEIIEQVSHWAPYDFVFVDAGHLDDEVRADWANYGPMVAPGGLIAFHDIIEHEGLPRIQVFHLWAELKAENTYIEIVSPGGSGIGVLVL